MKKSAEYLTQFFVIDRQKIRYIICIYNIKGGRKGIFFYVLSKKFRHRNREKKSINLI